MTPTRLYIGLDVETAHRYGGVCEFAAIGVDAEGVQVFRVASLVDPGPVDWDAGCIGVHGIDPRRTIGQPPLPTVWAEFLRTLAAFGDGVARVFAHNASFERRVLAADLGLAELPIPLECTLRLARLHLRELESRTLDRVAAALGVALERHHRAEPDAKATAEVARLLDRRATPETPELASRGKKRDPVATVARRGDALAGEFIAFTGAFANGLERRDAQALAAAHGAIASDGVSRKTTILVVAGVGHPIPPASLTTNKATEAVARGIRLMSEPEFLVMVGAIVGATGGD